MILEHALVELVQDIGCNAGEDVAMREVGPEWFIHRLRLRLNSSFEILPSSYFFRAFIVWR